MSEGAFVGEFDGQEATQEKIMHAIMRNKALGGGQRGNDIQTGEMRP
jgi:hypothetical protein